MPGVSSFLETNDSICRRFPHIWSSSKRLESDTSRSTIDKVQEPSTVVFGSWSDGLKNGSKRIQEVIEAFENFFFCDLNRNFTEDESSLVGMAAGNRRSNPVAVIFTGEFQCNLVCLLAGFNDDGGSDAEFFHSGELDEGLDWHEALGG